MLDNPSQPVWSASGQSIQALLTKQRLVKYRLRLAARIAVDYFSAISHAASVTVDNHVTAWRRLPAHVTQGGVRPDAGTNRQPFHEKRKFQVTDLITSAAFVLHF